MAYLESGMVNSFPSTKRASVNKLITENSITRLINKLIDQDSYVITNGIDADFTQDIDYGAWAGKSFEFVIHGYYFSVSNGEGYSSGLQYIMSKVPSFVRTGEQEKTLCARIFIDISDEDFPELYGQDDEGGDYKAIQFCLSDDPVVVPDGLSEYDWYQAPLVRYCQNDAGVWQTVVPLDALFKFKSSSIKNIDGGEIIL